MSFRAWLAPVAVRQVHGLPDQVIDELVRLLARICEAPYDMVVSAPVRPGDLSKRVAELGEHGFVEFLVDEDAALVRVYAVAWVG